MLVFFAILLFSSVAYGESSCDTSEKLSRAINAWTGPSKYVNWFECGSKTDREERANEYASLIFHVSGRGNHDPSIVAAILEQESGYDRCQVGGPTRRSAGLPVHPTKAAVIELFGTEKARKARRVSRLDLGAAQFLWPYGAPYRVTEGVPIEKPLSLDWTIEALGMTLTKHRESAKRRVSVFNKVLLPNDYYWTYHHTGYNFSKSYYGNVIRRANRLARSCNENNGKG